MNTFLAQACINLRPTAGISIDENGVHWHNIKESEIPTQSEVDAEIIRLQKEYETNEYKAKRAAEYPSYADQFDTIFHNGLDAWKAQIQAIKDKYPKGVA
jgi:hypothetical protein